MKIARACTPENTECMEDKLLKKNAQRFTQKTDAHPAGCARRQPLQVELWVGPISDPDAILDPEII